MVIPTTGASPVAMRWTMCAIIVGNNEMASISLFPVFLSFSRVDHAWGLITGCWPSRYFLRRSRTKSDNSR